MLYKTLSVGDPHAKPKSLHLIRQLKTKIIEVIYKERPNGVVIMGDLHDTHAHSQTTVWMEEVAFLSDIDIAAAEVGAWVRYTVGNHDIPSNNLYLERIHPFRMVRAWREGTIVDYPATIDTPVGSMGFIPYVPNGRFREAKDLIGPTVATFCHQEFKSSDMGHGVASKTGDDYSDDMGIVIAGHIHKRQILFDGRLYYVGSPYQTTFDEDPNKTISMFEFDGKGVREVLIPTDLPKKITHTVTIEEAKTLELSEKDENRVIISDTSVNIAAAKNSAPLKKLDKKAKLIFKPTDKVFVRREVGKKTFRELLLEYAAKEDPSVLEAVEDVLREAAI